MHKNEIFLIKLSSSSSSSSLAVTTETVTSESLFYSFHIMLLNLLSASYFLFAFYRRSTWFDRFLNFKNLFSFFFFFFSAFFYCKIHHSCPGRLSMNDDGEDDGNDDEVIGEILPLEEPEFVSQAQPNFFLPFNPEKVFSSSTSTAGAT